MCYTQPVRPIWLNAILLSFATSALLSAGSLVDDRFTDGNSQNQDLAQQSLRLFNARSGTVRTDAVGSVAFKLTNSGGADAFWSFFTAAGAPVRLGVGDRLQVSVTFALTGFPAGGQDIRFGVLDSQGSRNAANLTGGMNDSTFINDTGYGVFFYPSGATGSPFVIGRRTTLTAGNLFNSSADFPALTLGASGATSRQTLAENTPYALTLLIERTSATETRLTASVVGGTTASLSYSVSDSSSAPLSTFDYFAFRVGGATLADTVTFSRLNVEYSPAAPIITAQPQPPSLTVQTGSTASFAVGAAGNALTYQWRKDGVDLNATDNPSAATSTLSLSNIQLADAGSYAAAISNAGGTVLSDAVVLKVSTTPVPPPPAITLQPADTLAPIGSPATLSIAVSGANPVFTWFKNGSVLPGANGSTLDFSAVTLADAAVYSVLVSNSSGSVRSADARLTVVSNLTITGAWPDHLSANRCVDQPIRLDFDREIKAGTSGRIIISRVDGTVVDSIDLSAKSQARLSGGVSFNYYPVQAIGSSAFIRLHQRLDYGQRYFIAIEPGVLTDADGVPWAGMPSESWTFETKSAAPPSGTSALTVSTDSLGDFCSIQGAVDFVPANNTRRVTITVRPDVYRETIYVASNKPFITLRGEDRSTTVIDYPNNATLNPSARGVLWVDAADFILETLTIRNSTPKGGSQAEAFRGNAQRISLNQVNLLSYQDTLWLQGAGYVNNSYIEGDVDFLWGSGAVVVANSELKMLTSNGYYTQIRNAQDKTGYVFLNCYLTAAPGVTGGYLSRIDPGVYPYSQVVFIDTVMGSHIRPEGWLLNNAATAPTVQFLEYNSMGPDGKPIDVSQRAAFSKHLTATEAAAFRDTAKLLGFAPPAKLSAGINLISLSRIYDGQRSTVGASTMPAGLALTITYNGSPLAPVDAGVYTVVATINDPVYQGVATATLTIERCPVSIYVSDLRHIYDGMAKSPSVSTIPTAVFALAFNGSPGLPTEIGRYAVQVSLPNPNFIGGASATMTILDPNKLQLPAFPGAEGAGAYTPGGRGGDVYHVTNLADSGPGSLRYGIATATGPRTIVFDLSGTIYLKSKLSINKPNLTLAGHTAPGSGITVAGFTTQVSDTHDVVIRYMRFREGDINCPTAQDDTLGVDRSTDVILDHVSASWSIDETLSITDSDRVTVGWSFITESLRFSCHLKGEHGYGSLIRYGSGNVSYHHNLYAHHESRNPRVGDNITLDFVNNVIYNWDIFSGYSGTADEGTTRLNYVGNYLVAGPNTPAAKRSRAFDGGSLNTLIYQSNNLIDANPAQPMAGFDTGWSMFSGDFTRQDARFDLEQVETSHARIALGRVLDEAGASIARDAVDLRIVQEVWNKTGRQIDSQNAVGGFPALFGSAPPRDSDGDGIPDEWEASRGLDPSNVADGALLTANGYSNLEVYLNELAARLMSAALSQK